MIKNNTEVLLRTLVECELIKCKAFNQDDNKNKLLLGEAKASVARNLKGALLLLKGTIK